MVMEELSGLHRGIVVAISVGCAILILLIVALLVFWLCMKRSAPDSDSLYYKFDAETNLPSADSLEDTAGHRKTHKERRVDVQAANRKWGYADEADIVDVEEVYRDKLGNFSNSYTSVDDAIYAPRMEAHEVQSSGVGYLDDYGRPIASPYR